MKKKCYTKALATSLLLVPLTFSSLHAADLMLKASAGKAKGSIKWNKGNKEFDYWKGTNSGAQWTFEVTKAGKTTISVDLAMPGENGGDIKVLLNGKEILTKSVTPTGGWGKYKTFNLGSTKLTEGTHTLSILSKKANGSYFANMKGIKLESKTAEIKAAGSAGQTVTTGETLILKAGKGKTKGSVKWNSGKREYDYWKGKDSGVTWTINATKPGKQSLYVDFAAEPGAGGQVKILVNGKQQAVASVKDTGGWDKYKTYNLGVVELKKGKNTVAVVTTKSNKTYFANMRGGRLGGKAVSSEADEISIITANNGEDFILKPDDAKLIGKLTVKGRSWDRSIENWSGTDTGASWKINVKEPGTQAVFAKLAANSGYGGELKVLLDGKEAFTADFKSTGSWKSYKTFKLGEVKLTKGEHTITILSNKLNKNFFANMKGASVGFAIYEKKETFAQTISSLVGHEKVNYNRVKRVVENLWKDFPHATAWLTQDCVDLEDSNDDPRYDYYKDLLDYFNSRSGSDFEEEMIGRVIDELPEKKAKTLTNALLLLKATKAPTSKSQWIDLYVEACKERRIQRLQPLLSEISEVIFAKHHVFGASSNILYITETEGETNPTSLVKLNLTPEMEGEFATETVIVEENDGILRDPEINYDGTKMLFAWRKTGVNVSTAWQEIGDRENYQIHEMDLQSGKTRQLTNSETYGASFEPCYLPNGDIIFSSSRIVQHITCGWGDCSNLFIMNKDGKYQRRLGFDQTNTAFPTVLNDGRIVFLRRDYNDRGQSSAHALFQMKQDGTGQTEYYGNQTGTPNSFSHTRAIPGSSKVMTILGGYHTTQGGQLALMDVRKGRNGNKGLWQIPQNILPESDDGYNDQYGKKGAQYSNPYPFSEKEFLVSRSEFGRKDRGPEHHRLYFMTADGRRELLASDSETSCLQAVPVKKRKKPPVTPSLVDYTKDTGVFYMQNAYIGDAVKGVKPGSIKKVRVVEILYKPASIKAAEGQGPGGAWHTVTPAGHPLATFDAKKIIGEATVYDDGSAMFEVPARTPVYLQLLDKHNRVIQTMRSWATLMPNEKFSCVGCHENKDDTPVMGGHRTMAMKQGVEKLKEFYGPARGFSFMKEVQPVFDKHCVSCHAEGEKGESLKLTAKPFVRDNATGRSWSTSYVELMTPRPGPNPSQFNVKKGPWARSGKAMDDEPNQYINYWTRFELMGPGKPYRAGSIASKLIDKMLEGHGKAPQEAIDKVAAWIDLNVPFIGDYAEQNIWNEGLQNRYSNRVEERKRNEKIEQANIKAFINDGQP